jgi:hypothetical protein
MTKKIFNPQQWLQDNSTDTLQCVSNPTPDQITKTNQQKEVEEIITRIEAKNIDIATAYGDWRDIGFAFASEFSEQGRDYFHRISRFYPDYSTAECDKQFDKCLKANGSGVTLKTFFHKAKDAGINISTQNTSVTDTNQFDDFIETPCIPDEVFNNLPSLLKDACSVFPTQREKDIMLLGSIVTLSSCMANVFGIYFNDKIFANLYLFVTAQASAGKGSLKHCKRLVFPVHKQLRDASAVAKSEYQIEMQQYLQEVKKDPTRQKPEEPKDKMLFLPANNSSTGVFQLLDDCDGRGLIFETEGDTLAQIFKTDYGNYSDGFRKAFHHENISYYRRTNREYVDIENPRLSAVLTGTPRQITHLIPDAEDGLFSRFMYYRFSLTDIWNDVFKKQTANGFESYFNELGNRFYSLFQSLTYSSEKEFSFTPAQQQQFNKCFKAWQTEFISVLGPESVANVRRLGLICFRMAMIMTVLRIEETGEDSNMLYCSDTDFNNSMQIGRVLLDHAKTVYLQLCTMSKNQKPETMKDKFYSLLPVEFTRKEAVEIAAKLNIKPRTTDKYLSELTPSHLTKDPLYGRYKKASGSNQRTVLPSLSTLERGRG